MQAMELEWEDLEQVLEARSPGQYRKETSPEVTKAQTKDANLNPNLNQNLNRKLAARARVIDYLVSYYFIHMVIILTKPKDGISSLKFRF
jgi:hypothetical protein